jgi:hypothetical protein
MVRGDPVRRGIERRSGKTKRTQAERRVLPVSIEIVDYFDGVATGGGAVVVTGAAAMPPQLLQVLQVLQVLQQVVQQDVQHGGGQQRLRRRPASAESGVRATTAVANATTIHILRNIPASSLGD